MKKTKRRVKRKLIKKNLFKLIFYIILIIFIYLLINGKINLKKEKPNIIDTKDNIETINYLNNMKYDIFVEESTKQEIEPVLTEYFNKYYYQMKYLEEIDMSEIFNDDEQSYLNKTTIDLLVEIRKLKSLDLTLSKANYDLTIKKIKITTDEIELLVLEDSHITFNALKNESNIYEIENEITLKRVNDEYKIESFNKYQDFFVMVTDKYETSSDYKNKLDTIKKDYLTITKKKIDLLKKDYNSYLKNPDKKSKTCDNEFNRVEAKKYALEYVNKRNSEWDSYDSNCQNFASQVLYAGGIPMDIEGDVDLQWKYYDSKYNSKQTKTGYVYSWTYVPGFRTYASENDGYGLCAIVDENFYYAEPGDIIQVGSIHSERHTVVVVDTLKDKKGNVVDIIVNSNSVDLENYPMSAYVYPYRTLIKIYGWNN